MALCMAARKRAVFLVTKRLRHFSLDSTIFLADRRSAKLASTFRTMLETELFDTAYAIKVNTLSIREVLPCCKYLCSMLTKKVKIRKSEHSCANAIPIRCISIGV